jgi:hypothetical protein
MKTGAAFLLAFTAAMVAVHLTSGRLLRWAWAGGAPGWLNVRNIFRFEAAYYVALMAYVVWGKGRFLLAPLLAMAVLHIGGWAVAEGRRGWLVESGGEAARARILKGVQIFDLGETVVLVYVAWVLARALVTGG